MSQELAHRFDPKRLRTKVLQMAYAGNAVHVPCAFSIVEILAALYRDHLVVGQGPKDPARDYLVLSKGHGVMALYACFNELGWLPDEELERYFADGTRLKGLSDADVPGVEVTSGSLGHGLSVGVGLALAAKRSGQPRTCYAIVGDGEMNEGPIWEALLFAHQFTLDNLVVIVDQNGFQAMGRTDEVLALGELRQKFEAFGFDALDVDGHSIPALSEAVGRLRRMANGRPKAIVARTVKGQGVSFIAGDNRWHYTRLTPETYQAALAELQ